MIALIQCVTHADVKVNQICIGEIQQGILALIGIEKTDTENEAQKIFDKVTNYRIFPDTNGKTNLSLKDINGGLLLVPQFTLVADTQSGLRPDFSKGMPPTEGKLIFEYLVHYAQSHFSNTASGQFGAYMEVSLCNDGPMTFILQSGK